MTPRLPTTDIYFAHACHDWLDRWWSRRPVKALGRNSFVAGRTMVLFRRDDDRWMRHALNWSGPLIYLIDDDIAGAAETMDLPPEYRRRLEHFDRTYHQRLLERADVIIVPSEALAKLFAANSRVSAKISLIFPHWPLAFADTRHFDGLAQGDMLRIVHLGSGSHAGAFDALAPTLSDMLAAHADAHLTYIGREPHGALPDHDPQVTRIDPKRWPVYRHWLARQRFHLAMYPLADTRFDAARSPNKLIEHAVIGAVGMYPENWPIGDLADGGSLTAPADPGKWGAAIAQAVERRASLSQLADQAARAVARRNDPAAQRALWSELLDLAIA